MKVNPLSIFKTAVICILLLLQVSVAIAQKPWPDEPHQQLLEKLNESKPDSSRVFLLLGLSQQSYQKFNWKPKDADSAYNLIKEAELLSIKLKSDFLMGNVEIAYGRLYRKEINYVQSLAHFQHALQLFTDLDNKFVEAVIYYDMALLYKWEGTSLDKKVACLEKGLALLANSQTDTHALNLEALANAIAVQGKYQEALVYLNQALVIYKATGFKKLDHLYNDWAVVFEKMDNVPEELRYRLLALKTAEEQNDTSRYIGKLYYGVGKPYYTLNDWKNAEFYHRKALAVAEKYADSTQIAATAGSLVDALIQLRTVFPGPGILCTKYNSSSYDK